jgi:hypothetical protein
MRAVRSRELRDLALAGAPAECLAPVTGGIGACVVSIRALHADHALFSKGWTRMGDGESQLTAQEAT